MAQRRPLTPAPRGVSRRPPGNRGRQCPAHRLAGQLARAQALGRVRDQALALVDCADLAVKLGSEWLGELQRLGLPLVGLSLQRRVDRDDAFALGTLPAPGNAADLCAHARRPWVAEAWSSQRAVWVPPARLAASGETACGAGSLVELPLGGWGSLAALCRDGTPLALPMMASLEEFGQLLAVVLQRQEELDRRRARTRELNLLQDVGRRLSSSLDVETLFEATYRAVREIMDCHVLIVSEFDADTQLIRCTHLRLGGQPVDVGLLPLIPLEPEGQGMQSQVIRTGEPFLVADYDAVLRRTSVTHHFDEDGVCEGPPPPEEERTQSALLVPLLLEGAVVGVLQTQSTRLNAYVPDHVGFLAALSAHLAIALNNSRLFGQARDELARRREAESTLRESEARYRRLFEGSHDALATLAPPTWHFTSGNPAALAIFGLSGEAELLARTPWDLSPPCQPDGTPSQAAAEGLLAAAVAAGGPAVRLWWHQRADGTRFPATVVLTALEQGGRAFVLATIRDNTERQRHELALRVELALQRLRTAAVAMRSEADWASVQGAFEHELADLVSCQRCALGLTDGVSQALRVYQPASALAAAEWRPVALPEPIQRTLQAGLPVTSAEASDPLGVGPRSASLAGVSFGGGVLFTYSDQMDAFGERELGILERFAPVAAEASRRLQDLEALHRLTAEVEAQRLRALHADRLQALGEMAAGVAHELNQPLNGIRAFAEGALYGIRHGWPLVAEDIGVTFTDIVQQVDRITAIVDHMRVFARDSAESEPEQFALHDVVEGALKLVGAQLRVHGIQTRVDVPRSLPWVIGRPNQIEQVVLNLISNARDALATRQEREGCGWCGELRLVAALSPDGQFVQLGVSDNGGGIPEHVIDRVFEPFFTTKDVGKGTGLGLSIARAITEKHHGRLVVDNRPGHGVSFAVHLPAAPV